MTKTIALIHTVSGLVPVFGDLMQKHLGDCEIFNMVDESLLKNTIRTGHLEQDTMRRVAGHIFSAVDGGADAIMVTCSSIGPAVDAAREFCPVPLVRVDEGMASEALKAGERIGVLATLSSTMVPTRNLIERLAGEAGKPVTLSSDVCEGAFEKLMAGETEAHDRIVGAALTTMAGKVDAIVLDQASMARVLASMPEGKIAVPVFSSPELGVINLKAQMGP